MSLISRFSRRQLLKMAGVATAASALASCAPASAPAQEPEAPAKETVVVTETVVAEATPAYEQGELDILLCCSSPEEQEAKLRFNDRFMESHPGVTVNQEPMPAGQSYFEKLQTVMAAGTAPDIYDMWEGYVQPYAENDALVNLDPYLEKDGKLSKTDIWPAVHPAISWNGSMYSLLIGIMPGPVSLFYNKKLLDAAGVEYPTNDWTWDDMREAALGLTTFDASGEPDQYGLVFANWFVPWLYWIWSNGGDIFNADETACVLGEAAACEAIQYWADLVVKDKVAPNSSTTTAMQGPENMFKTDLVGLYLGNCWDLQWLDEAAEGQGLEWGSALAPTTNSGNRVFYQHTWCWGIWTGTKKPNLAWEYVRDFCTEEEMLTEFNTFSKIIPADKRLLSTFLTPETEALGWAGVVDTLGDTSKLRYPGSGSKWDKIADLTQAEIDLVFTGDKTAEEAAKDACIVVDEELARS